jgi:diguanylate cyclase (GGDEF)-like protein
VPADLVVRVQAAQLTTRAKLVPRMAAAGSAVAIALGSSFISQSRTGLLYLSLSSVLIGYVVLVLTARNWLMDSKQEQSLDRYRFRFSLIQLLIGTSWGAVLANAMPLADPREVATLYALAIGLISTSVFSGPAVYSLAFWTPVTIGSFISLCVDAHRTSFTAVIGLLSYSALTLSSIFSLDAKLIEREVQKLEADRHRELVQLLMRDFEEEASDWLWETNADLVLRRVSQRFADVARRTQEKLLLPISDLLLSELDQEADPDKVAAVFKLLDQMSRNEAFRDVLVPFMLKSEVRWWSLSGKPHFNEVSQFQGYRGVGTDVTEAERAREKINFIASHDLLTKLWNRMRYDEVLQNVCGLSDDQESALLSLDLDHFKNVNDSFGHATGDALLAAVADRIRGSIRSQDFAFRLGGDEFAVILAHTDRNHATSIAERIIDRLNQPFIINQVMIKIGACVGLSLIPTDGRVPDQVHRKADLALYRAKAEGRGTYRMFTLQMDTRDELIRSTSVDLSTALELARLIHGLPAVEEG